MASVLYAAALLFPLTCSASADVTSLSSGMEVPTEAEAKQCLMQKRHHVARHDRTPELQKLLPEHLIVLARTLFKNDDVIADVVENSVPVNIKYAGVQMALRMNKDDDAVRRMGEEGTWFSYDLDTLNDAKENSEDMINMLDIGGNYGVVTIAAMKKHAQNLRVIVVEPIPTTFFFLKWNMFLNGVPEIEKDALDERKKTPGVLALNRGSGDAEGQDLHLCFDPKSSMNSRVCECKQGEDKCIIVPSVTVDNLVGMFGTQQISMVKMDCEGCEFKTLPALTKPEVSKRVRRLAGELHLPDEKLEELACRWDRGRLMSKCQLSGKKEYAVECDVRLACKL